jgi:hypothetical protein
LRKPFPQELEAAQLAFTGALVSGISACETELAG